MEERIQKLEQEMREHYHNGVVGRQIPISNLVDFIPVVSVVPTHIPRRFIEQFRIYSSGTTYRWYWYDWVNHAWRYTELGGAGTPGGSDTEIQFNDAGAFQGSSFFKYSDNGGTYPTVTMGDGSAQDALLRSTNTSTFFIESDGSLQVDAQGGSYILMDDSTPNMVLGGEVEGDGGDWNCFDTHNTNDTQGFLYISKCAGTPTGVPVSGNGAMMYDTTNNKLYVYNGAWKSVTLS